MYTLRANNKPIAKSKSFETLFNYVTNYANCTKFAGNIIEISDEFGVIDTFQIAPMVTPDVLHVTA